MADVLPPPAATNGEVFSEKAHKNVVTQEEFLRPDFDPKEMKQVASEAILLAGGAYAVLLQMAYPGVAKGVVSTAASYHVTSRRDFFCYAHSANG